MELGAVQPDIPSTPEITGHNMKILQKSAIAASLYVTSNPALSRFFVLQKDILASKMRVPYDTDHLSCPYCGSIYRPGNHKVTVISNEEPVQKAAKLQKRPKVVRKSGLKAKKDQNMVEILCNICTRTDRINCQETLKKTTNQNQGCHSAEVKLSYKQRRKLSKKQSRRQKNSQGDSGIEWSLTRSLTGTPTGSTTGSTTRFTTGSMTGSLSSLSSSGDYGNRTGALSDSRLTMVIPKYTSTPVIQTRGSTHQRNLSLFESKSELDLSEFKQPRNTKRKGSSLGALHQMLAKQKEDAAKNSGHGSLKQFLTTV